MRDCGLESKRGVRGEERRELTLTLGTPFASIECVSLFAGESSLRALDICHVAFNTNEDGRVLDEPSSRGYDYSYSYRGGVLSTPIRMLR